VNAAGSELSGHKKTVSDSETVAGQYSKNNGNAKGKISKTNSSEDLLVYSRLLAQQGAALHQQVFQLKHGAKLRHCYVTSELARQELLLKDKKRVCINT
jgi:hypothetical protein